jgi:3-oxoacyl-(acyl-carrier-protein) synthase
MRRVVITGLGPITSVRIGKKALWESLQTARSGIGPVTYFDPSIFNVHSASEIKDWLFAFGQVRRLHCLADVEPVFQPDDFGSHMTTCRLGLLKSVVAGESGHHVRMR